MNHSTQEARLLGLLSKHKLLSSKILVFLMTAREGLKELIKNTFNSLTGQ